MDMIDTHCHLDFPDFDTDRMEVLSRTLQQQVSKVIIPGVKADTWEQLIEFCNPQPALHFALGLHPYFINDHNEEDLAFLTKTLKGSGAVAVGEIGLDFYQKHHDKNKQIHFFHQQLKIAGNLNLPVIIHARKSHDEIIKQLQLVDFNAGGSIHAFNGSLQQADKYIAMNFKLGFGGMLTYERSSKLRDLAEKIPLRHIVLETDAPDMTGFEHHGQRNSPEYLPEIAKTLANIKKVDFSVVAKQTSINARSCFKLC